MTEVGRFTQTKSPRTPQSNPGARESNEVLSQMPSPFDFLTLLTIEFLGGEGSLLWSSSEVAPAASLDNLPHVNQRGEISAVRSRPGKVESRRNLPQTARHIGRLDSRKRIAETSSDGHHNIDLKPDGNLPVPSLLAGQSFRRNRKKDYFDCWLSADVPTIRNS